MNQLPPSWLIISSKQNLEITASQEWTVQGFKRRHRKKVIQMMPGDRLFYYITGEQKLAAAARITAPIFESQEPLWVNLGKDPTEIYPWRVGLEPLTILAEENWIPIEPLIPDLRYFRKWPKPHWRLGLQGQLHSIFPEDGDVLLEKINNSAC